MCQSMICTAFRLRSSSKVASKLHSTVTSTISTPCVAGERYVATNRFKVKSGREGAFEKRWADRQSRLGTLDGFRFFCMMRRLPEGESTATKYEDDINYISCTIWKEKENFDTWRKGDAFKEAHGGGTIGGVAGMLLATAMNTKGKPKPAMWEGILPVSMTPSAPTPGGWRQVEADGSTMLDSDCFLAMNRFSVKTGFEAAFESRFAKRDSTLSSFEGFRGFLLLRKDGADEDGFTHSTFSVWDNKAAFEVWQSTPKDRAGKPKPEVDGTTAKPIDAPAGAGGPPKGGPPNIFVRPPVPTFYEGILTLESAAGV